MNTKTFKTLKVITKKNPSKKKKISTILPKSSLRPKAKSQLLKNYRKMSNPFSNHKNQNILLKKMTKWSSNKHQKRVHNWLIKVNFHRKKVTWRSMKQTETKTTAESVKLTAVKSTLSRNHLWWFPNPINRSRKFRKEDKSNPKKSLLKNKVIWNIHRRLT